MSGTIGAEAVTISVGTVGLVVPVVVVGLLYEYYVLYNIFYIKNTVYERRERGLQGIE